MAACGTGSSMAAKELDDDGDDDVWAATYGRKCWGSVHKACMQQQMDGTCMQCNSWIQGLILLGSQLRQCPTRATDNPNARKIRNEAEETGHANVPE
eukprot:1160493-Pelagomonas_calceolata.AAC.5